MTDRTGQVMVLFISTRTEADDAGYARAAAEMDALAAEQPGYRGVESVRDAGGHGMTASFWASEADAVAWRGVAEHAAIRATGRERWYQAYEVIVATVTRGYRWAR
jgi:heme-degrading monooxygenase HmoA